jgi:hypothetical protein
VLELLPLTHKYIQNNTNIYTMYTCLQTGQWNFGGTPLQFVKFLSDETDGLFETYCLEALAYHTFVRILSYTIL